MRKIKFRGKCIEHSKDCGWVYGSLVISGKNYHILDEWIKGKGHLKHQIEPKSCGEYTGLKDKNGKEIYEGDVVQYLFASKKVVREVYWNDINFCWTPLNQNPLDMEIIGNIYENKNLLKKNE